MDYFANIPWKSVIIGLSVGQFCFENYLEYRQYQVLKRAKPPKALEAEITGTTLAKSQDYSRAKIRFGFFSGLYSFACNFAYIKYDALPKFWAIGGSWMAKAAPILPKFMNGVITQSLFFISVFQLANFVLQIPTLYYSTFVLEEKYGFNKSTLGLWILDALKSLGLSIVLGLPVLAGFIKIVDYFGNSFVFWTCIFMLAVNLIGITIFPTLIQPLFNKFSPLEDGELKTAIEALAKEHDFPLQSIFVVDGSKRSSHLNAYFIGLPWSKKIVLFDTLLEHLTVEETVAVLAHEIGHWKLLHLPKMLLAAETNMMFIFYLFSFAYRNSSLYQLFGFVTVQPTIVGFLLFSDLFLPLACVTQFMNNALLRKHEYEADQYAKGCGYDNLLARALIKLLVKNLSAMDADWLYLSYNHSHPILADRLRAIDYVLTEKVVKEEKKEKEVKAEKED